MDGMKPNRFKLGGNEGACNSADTKTPRYTGSLEADEQLLDINGLSPHPRPALLGHASASTLDSEEGVPLLLPVGASSFDPPSEKDNVAVGMLWYGLSSIFFSGMGICAKLLGRQGYPVWEITLFRAVIILACSLSVLLHAGDNPLGTRRLLLVLRGSAGFGSVTCYFLACQLLPIADATTLTFLAPLIVAVLSPVLLKEKMSPATLVVMPVCLGGVLLITQPALLFGKATRELSTVGIVLGLVQPFFSAGAKMLVRVLRTTEKTNVMVFYLMMCTLVYSLIGCAASWNDLRAPATGYEWALLLAQGLFGYGNQICITKGLANAKAAPVMCMQFLSIVVSQVAGMVMFQEFTSPLGDLGMSIIIVSIMIYMWHESRAKQ